MYQASPSVERLQRLLLPILLDGGELCNSEPANLRQMLPCAITPCLPQADGGFLTCLVTGNLEPIGWGKMSALGISSLFSNPK